MADTQVTVRITAEDRQTWLVAAEMHRKNAERIDNKDLHHTAACDVRNTSRTARRQRGKVRGWTAT